MFEYVFGEVIPFEYFVNLLLDHNEMDIILKLSCVNRKYNYINREILTNIYTEFIKKYKKEISKCYVNIKNNDIIKQFLISIEYGNINVAKYIYGRYHDNLSQNEDYLQENKLIFIVVCMKGHLRIAKWIYLLFVKTGKIKIGLADKLILNDSPQHVKKWLNTL